MEALQKARLALALGLIGLLLIPGCSKTDEELRGEHAHASAIGEPARAKPFVASVRREPFHRPDCRWARKINEANLVGYDSREDAIADAHRPCRVCSP